MNYSDILVKNDSFKSAFEKEWLKTISTFNLSITQSQQLNNGNRLRPLLFAWGYTLNNHSISDINLEKIARLSLCVEMVHKASIIVDDIVDNDDYRNGQLAFHIEHTINEGIVFSNFLINQSIIQFNEELNKICLSPEYISRNTSLLMNTISSMTRGCLKELSLNKNLALIDTDIINEILDLETTSLIRDSLLLGYLSNNEYNPSIYNALRNIGHTYGHIFQMLNDLEPFNKDKLIINHKKRYSLDLQRKNIAISILKGLCSKKDLKILDSMEPSEESYEIIVSLLEKYNVKLLIIKDVNYLIGKLSTSYLILETYNNIWTHSFKTFQEYLLDYALNRI